MRPRRYQHPGAFYHVYSRGNRRGNIFLDQSDYQKFESLLFEKIIAAKSDLYAWCLMPNHFHLLLKTEEPNLSLLMQRILTAYARSFNKKHKLVGHVFQGRYKARVCEEDAYLMQLIRYIHLNPVKVRGKNLVRNLEDWVWSSHRFYQSGGGPSGIQKAIDKVLRRFSPSCSGPGTMRYREYIEEGLTMGHGGVFKGLAGNGFLGSDEFVENLKKASGETVRRTQRIIYQRMTVEQLGEKAAVVFGVSSNNLRGNDKVRNLSRIRQAIIYVGRNFCRIPTVKLADYLKRDSSAISKIVLRKEKHWAGLLELKKLMEALGGTPKSLEEHR